MKMNINRIKLLCLVLLVAGGISINFHNSLTRTASADAGGPPAGRTGAPGETTCSSCHDGAVSNGQFTISAPQGYVPGQTYQITVTHSTTDLTRMRWGFELTALINSNNTKAGDLALINTLTTRLRNNAGPGSARQYVEQNGGGTFVGQTLGANWTFNWTAPATNVGPITMYAAGIQADNDGDTGGDATLTTTFVLQPRAAVKSPLDFDGDGKTDFAVVRNTGGGASGQMTWFILRSSDSANVSFPWGIASDKFVSADFDGDGKADPTIWRSGPPFTAAFYILQSATNTLRVVQFGQTGDDPSVVGDYDGDGKADPAVYRSGATVGAQSFFFYRGSLNNPNGNITYVPWGTSGDLSAPGDYDGDSKYDFCVRRDNGNGQARFYILRTTSGFASVMFGTPTDLIVPGDYNGDGKTDISVVRGINGVFNWYIDENLDGVQDGSQIFGASAADLICPGDYNGDGRTDFAIWRPNADPAQTNFWVRPAGTTTHSAQR